ncbi:hypothetical protein Q8W71_13875 [Methylobacterium sp. NEAU 140]|uniref:hypothetical protein n=1 Tax=Methylobacterium sp. NEAU 140 TaxID=3064945 RepID=UPI0027342478|nr:hypothetical protein [Methylobacterium sp. NEAU 140]MDP4023720.1 hypothetical protein [Methylobacterium sp. NEAU 140]
MPKPIGFHAATGTLVIMENGEFPAGSLIAHVHETWTDRIQIDTIAGRGAQTVLWQDVTSLDGMFTPASMADALAYLRGEFAKRPALRPILAPYPLAGAASFAINHGLPYAPSTTVVSSDGAEVDTDVAHAPGLTTLTFAQPFTGTLYLG